MRNLTTARSTAAIICNTLDALIDTMCLLVFSFGFSSCPLLVCNNRDEFLSRPTRRGHFHENLRTYAPIDIEAGGTWIAFSEVNARFVVVLNYHQWRSLNSLYRHFFPPPQRISRGTLAMNFITSDDSVTAQEYAFRVSPQCYAGFNLIVGDKSGCYYVSNCESTPMQLEPRRFYGISNGRLETWEKSILCKQRVQSLMEPQLSHHIDEASVADISSKLLKILQDPDPLPDPTFGWWWPIYTISSAIFVDRELNPFNDFCTRTTTIAVAYRDNNLNEKLLIVENDLAADTYEWSIQEHSINFNMIS